MKELSTEQRLLLALVLSVVVVTVSDLLVFHRFKPAANKPTASQSIPASSSSSSASSASKPPAKPVAPLPTKTSVAAPATPAQTVQPKVEASQERSIVVESPVYRVVLSNRGAVARSWQLKKYGEEANAKKVLDVVHPPANAQSDQWPLSLLMINPKLQSQANKALFQMTPSQSGATLHAPAVVNFRWSNGHLTISKQLRFSTNYVVDLHTSVTLDGKPVPYAVAWRGGFGDATVYHAPNFVQVFYSTDGHVNVLASKKLGAKDNAAEPFRAASQVGFAGIEDHYFAAAFLPLEGGNINAWDWRTEKQVKGSQEPVAEVAVGSPEANPGPVAVRLFVGPKSLRILGQVNSELPSLVHYGIMGIIAKPLFYVLRYIHNYAPNWGWAIVLLTVVLNMALFPLKMSSWRSMQKMQKVMPEMKAIQARYKKYGMRDPRRQKMNEEMMTLYQKEGVNPLGSCLPMLLQMPVWFALYEMLEVSIELRQAPWIFWIHDLSAHDPYYILPILMTGAGYVMQKMTPMTSPDPNQQRMMNFMPVIFGLLFFQLSSGLILYIFTSYLIGIAQQWYLNKTSPIALPAAGKAAGKKMKRQAAE